MPTTVVDSFDLPRGRVLAGRYTVEGFLGAGWEGEVYRVTEQETGIQRAAKIFYPQRNVKGRAVRFYATKLNRLRKCDIVIQYHHSIPVQYRGISVTCLISELVEGEPLAALLAHQRGGRLRPFEALHLLYSLTTGLEQIHRLKEYHGDLHQDNVLVARRGIGFDVKLVDFYHLGASSRNRRGEDIVDVIRLFYDAVGGQRRYRSQPPYVKAICRGLRCDLIARRFPTMSHLLAHLESFDWGRSFAHPPA